MIGPALENIAIMALEVTNYWKNTMGKDAWKWKDKE